MRLKSTLFKNLPTFQKGEFIVATLLFVILVFSVLVENPSPESELWGTNYLFHLIIITVFYLSFLGLNFFVLPNLKAKRKIWLSVTIIVLIIATSFFLFPNLQSNVLIIGFSIYFGLKFAFPTEIMLAIIFYVLLIGWLMVAAVYAFAITIPGVLIPFSIAIYAYSYYRLIPKIRKDRYPFLRYVLRVFLITLVLSLPLGFLGTLLSGDDDIVGVIVLVNPLLQILITAPVSWKVYLDRKKEEEEFQQLKQNLGNSEAELNFLQSQINPHFLFNALNTLYGKAIQEKAETTAEGIQQLGDMMRFMLHENMKERIGLEKELEYLRNYIQLQRLRLDDNADFNFEVSLPEEVVSGLMISPMLLIPLVENAFKHGISFRKNSYIEIALEVKNTDLHFTVKNSKSIKNETDPEKDKSGIGLQNVKQRLKLLYPEKHQLKIEQTALEFIVNLNLELNTK